MSITGVHRRGELGAALAIFSLVAIVAGVAGSQALSQRVTTSSSAQEATCPYRAEVKIYKDQRDVGHLFSNSQAYGWTVVNNLNQSIDLNKDGETAALFSTDSLILGKEKGASFNANDPATVTLVGPDKSSWKVKETFCIQKPGTAQGCPNSNLLSPANTTPDWTIEGFRVNCNVDVSYGWVLEKKDTNAPDPTIGRGGVTVRTYLVRGKNPTGQECSVDYLKANVGKNGIYEYLKKSDITLEGSSLNYDSTQTKGQDVRSIDFNDVPATSYKVRIENKPDILQNTCPGNFVTVQKGQKAETAVVLFDSPVTSCSTESTCNNCKSDGKLCTAKISGGYLCCPSDKPEDKPAPTQAPAPSDSPSELCKAEGQTCSTSGRDYRTIQGKLYVAQCTKIGICNGVGGADRCQPGPESSCETRNGGYIQCGNLNTDKWNKQNICDPACCNSDSQCPDGQSCSVGNGNCKSGKSCSGKKIGKVENTSINVSVKKTKNVTDTLFDVGVYECSGNKCDKRVAKETLKVFNASETSSKKFTPIAGKQYKVKIDNIYAAPYGIRIVKEVKAQGDYKKRIENCTGRADGEDCYLDQGEAIYSVCTDPDCEQPRPPLPPSPPPVKGGYCSLENLTAAFKRGGFSDAESARNALIAQCICLRESGGNPNNSTEKGGLGCLDNPNLKKRTYEYSVGLFMISIFPWANRCPNAAPINESGKSCPVNGQKTDVSGYINGMVNRSIYGNGCKSFPTEISCQVENQEKFNSCTDYFYNPDNSINWLVGTVKKSGWGPWDYAGNTCF